MRKNQLLAGAAFGHGFRRIMKDPEGHPGGIPGAAPDNAGAGQGNSGGDSGNPDPSQNNDGEGFDPTTFWDSPSEGEGAAPSGESAGAGNPPGGTESGNFAQQLTNQLANLTFGEPIFTQEVAEEINQGNFSGFEKRVQAQMQAAVRQSMALNVQVLRPFAEQLMNQMRQEFGSTLNNRDNNETLIRDFPAAKDPRVAPVIQRVFEQALTNTKGDRTKAVAQTKQMISLLTNTAAGDLDLDVAPRGQGDSRTQAPPINWLDELTGRS
jgi:hypothetical protein